MNFKLTIAVLIIIFGNQFSFGQNYSFKKKFGTQKNTVYFYWGYNRGIYSKSDVRFYSPEFDFTAHDLSASDRPARNFSTYVDPSTLTVPQFNIRLGWYYKHRWDISIGYDHMKYVMDKNQSLYLDGDAGNTSTSQLNGTYKTTDGLIPIRYEDLHYENTNGLNYVSVQLNNTVPLYKTKRRKFAVQRRVGVGLGPVITQTDFNWDGEEYHSLYKQFFSGYGISLHTGLRFDFFNHFFFQSNWSGGFIHLPKNPIATSQSAYAQHKFVYGQWELLGGFLFYIKTKNGCDSCPDWN
ncbi:hypothetical protein [Crocinitomix algicola]|uniref:hypothetical protein n=1 Tax=Crocinitomix algicola TaxID=1740263 RepID=UPI0008723E00|nr:hypothetical protein [Crocinitomix algicola]